MVEDLCISQIKFPFNYKNNTFKVENLAKHKDKRKPTHNSISEIPLLKIGVFTVFIL